MMTQGLQQLHEMMDSKFRHEGVNELTNWGFMVALQT